MEKDTVRKATVGLYIKEEETMKIPKQTRRSKSTVMRADLVSFIILGVT